MSEAYDFSWEDLGDLKVGRPNLGEETSVAAYRLMQFTFKDVLSKEVGIERAAELFVQAGELAGREFCRNVLNAKLEPAEFFADLQAKLIDLKIGVLRAEVSDFEALKFILTVSEDLDCSGLPVFGETVCDYDEGFLAGILGEYTGRKFTAKEVDCWATGDRTCRFDVRLAEG